MQQKDTDTTRLDKWLADNYENAPPPGIGLADNIIDHADNSDDDHDDDDNDNEEDTIIDLVDIEKFMFTGQPFLDFVNSFRILLLPTKLTHVTSSLLSATPGSISFSAENDYSISNRIKSFIEDHTVDKWDWWPFEPRMPYLKPSEVRVKWRCVSLNPVTFHEFANQL